MVVAQDETAHAASPANAIDADNSAAVPFDADM